ncbi:DUF4829 domain-containing protein [Desulfitobacterium sp.]|uniref:DUF4829 domain-containing protein n=1 Tax=Desulfitobacterium sp. TaxID=49981 RepID=UPI002B1FDC28|nr:DUF4829 domain-containing protein [Desulfitobacterium sp.]MEA4901922.1 DUF4829 domain-containing protein [Desulfitobacterium sp.]
MIIIRKSLLFILFMLLIGSFSVIGCSRFQRNTENINGSSPTTPVPSQKITMEDINEGKQVIRDYYNALKSRNLENLNRTLSKYQQGVYHKDNLGTTLEIDTIEYPGKYLNANIPPSSYKSNYGKDPYKSMCLHVTFTEGADKKDWDYILIKETEKSSWLIHDWGE